MKTLWITLLLVGLAGCAVSSPVVPAGKDSFTVSSHVRVCVSCSAAVKSMMTANAFCAKQGKTAVVRNTISTTNPFGYTVGNELVFSCVLPAIPGT